MYEKEATLLSMIGPIIKEGKKSLITFGNARVINGKKKKYKSFLIVDSIKIKENSITDKIPSLLNPGYANKGDLNEIIIHIILKM